ncbi:unnamed protein product [Caenorhabditis sp. 36 PRJEB53466]|nr:unnamed protein product [Caenorhabditis sp. 36 PRJEB53466]
MPSYKLVYFDARGYAEPARQMFYMAGVKFEDKRINRTDGSWEKIKEKTPFGQLPVLKVDGLEIPQSSAILRYLANKFGFAGNTPEENAWADAIVDQYKDFVEPFRTFVMAQRANKPVDEVEKIRTEVFEPARDQYFKILEGILKKSESGWLVESGLTWADLVVADNLVTLEKMGFFVPKEHPKLSALRKKVHGLARLKEYIANRPDTEF